MKKLMLSLFALSLSAPTVATEMAADIYTQAGYPYADLVRRSDSVRLVYADQKDKVSCRTEVQKQGQVWQGEAKEVSKKAFAKKPLQACLDRQQAKTILADVAAR